MSNEPLGIEIGGIQAQVFPGMFDEEVQATIKIGEREITVLASREDVVLETPRPSNAGSPGKLKVYLVDATKDGFLIDLPGEALGTTKRVIVNRSLISKVP